MDEARIESLLDQLTLEEQASLLAGADMWETVPIPRLGIPAIKVSDGPNGARGGGTLVGGVTAACLPVGIALASSWNPDLVRRVGNLLGEEALTKGARVLLAPTTNIHRSPLNGRNFECYSEDPYLSARLVVAYIKGVQDRGVAATVKHFICNDSEFERNTISSDLDERTLREIYLPPFEAAVKEADTWAVMSSYNKVNGTYVNESAWLQVGILKDEWGFDGIVMSDWFATHSTADAMNGGLDLEMPGPTQQRGAKLVAAVEAGEVSADVVREAARRVLRLIERVGAFDDPTIAEERAVDLPEHRAIARAAAAEGIVLLKNDGVLPLAPGQLSQVAVIGPNAKTAQIMGGGSAQVNAHYRVTPYEGVQAQLGEQAELSYEPGATNHMMLPHLQTRLVRTASGAPGFHATYYNSADFSGAPVWETTEASSEKMWFRDVGPGIDPQEYSLLLESTLTPDESGPFQFSLVSAGLSRLYIDDQLVVDNWDKRVPGVTYFGAGSTEAFGDYTLEKGRQYALKVEYSRSQSAMMGALRLGMFAPLTDDAIDRAVALAKEADVALVYVGTTGEWETEGYDRAGLSLPGNQDALITAVAAANPRTVVVLQTGGPVTMPWLGDVAAVLQAWFPGQECGNAITDVLTGAVNPSGRLPETHPMRVEDNPAFVNYPGENGRVYYGERMFVGYRYYDAKRIPVLFPFGFGLSYTSFGYGEARLSSSTIAADGTVTVSVDVTNTGERAGQDVVQVYVRDIQARLSRPEKELKGFVKLALEPGETKTATVTLDLRALAYYDESQRAWVAEAGEFEVLVGASAEDIRSRAALTLSETVNMPVGKAPRRALTIDNQIHELLEDDAARAVIERHIPGFSEHPQMVMAQAFSLPQISAFAPTQITPDAVRAIAADLAALNES